MYTSDLFRPTLASRAQDAARRATMTAPAARSAAWWAGAACKEKARRARQPLARALALCASLNRGAAL